MPDRAADPGEQSSTGKGNGQPSLQAMRGVNEAWLKASLDET